MRTAVIISSLILAILSLPFVFTDLDLVLQRLFFDANTQKWSSGSHPFWQFLYAAGPIPAILLAVTSLAVLLLGIGNSRLLPYRKLSAYFFLVLLIGAGLITNVILKGEWGRPRPRQVIEFAGTEKFEPLLHYDASSDGKSFPCGHATVGFYFLAFVPLLKRRRRTLVLIASLILGTLIGVARMAQGGHFASDTLWSAAVMWFTSLGLFHLLKLEDAPLYQPSKAITKPPAWMPWVSAAVVLVLASLGLTIWPYHKELDATPGEFQATGSYTLDYQAHGILEVTPGEAFTVICKANGHRPPKAKLKPILEVSEDTLVYRFEKYLFFSELDTHTTITLPPEMSLNIKGNDELETLILPKNPPSEDWPGPLKLKAATEIQRR